MKGRIARTCTRLFQSSLLPLFPPIDAEAPCHVRGHAMRCWMRSSTQRGNPLPVVCGSHLKSWLRNLDVAEAFAMGGVAFGAKVETFEC